MEKALRTPVELMAEVQSLFCRHEIESQWLEINFAWLARLHHLE